MSHDEFHQWLFKTGTGALGWTPQATMDADMTDIILAYEGRMTLIGDVLKAVFGSGETTSKGKPPKGKVDFAALPKVDAFTPDALDAVFG